MVTVTVVTASLKYLGEKKPVRTVLMMIVTPVLLDERLRIRYYQINTLHQQQKNRILLYCANTCCICCRSEICTTYEETRDKRRVKKVGLNGQILFKLTCKFNSMKHCILAVFITTAACFAFALDQQRDSSNSKRCQKKVSPAVARQSSGMNRKASRETTKKGNVASVAKTCNTVATLNAR